METKNFTHAGTREEWRKWLIKNHEKEDKVALIRHKRHTGKPTFNHREAMEEAICFGWIDTTIKRLDEERYILHFVKRKKNARWSTSTINCAKQMIKEKKMTPFGLKIYKEGLKKLPYNHGMSKNPEMSQDLIKELSKNKKINENFNNFPPSTKRMYLRWLESAKRKETKDKRIKSILKLAENKDKFGLLPKTMRKNAK